MNAYDYLTEYIQPERTAIVFKNETMPYSALIAAAESIGYTLQTMGVGRGDRVGLLAENSPFWVACYLAILKIGAVAAPMPQRLTPENLANLLRLVEARVLCADAPRVTKVAPALPDGMRILTNKVIHPAPAIFEPIPNQRCETAAVDDRLEMAALMFTSGSTGSPNAVCVSHRNIIANTESIIEYIGLKADDRMMVVLPFDYCFGTSLLHTHLRVGGSLVLENSFTFMEDFLNRLERTECTGFAGVPAIYQNLLRRSTLKKRQFPHLRHVQQAGGRLSKAFIEEFRAAHPQTRFFVMYGQTEATARLSYLPPECLESKLGSVGRGIPGVSLRVLNEAGDPVRAGERGEIVAEGDNIALGYWQPDPNKNPFRAGRLYTGDIATVDEEGFIFILDRESDFIKPNGHRIASREIEEVIEQIADVVECAVVGVPHAEMGEAAYAFVYMRKGGELSVRQILDYCKTKLPAYAVPWKTVFWPEQLPKNDSNKIMKKLLKTQALTDVQQEQELIGPNKPE